MENFYCESLGPVAARPRLSGAQKTDVCVVGGGFTGLSAALHLAEAGAKVILLEAQSIGFAASGRNGGQIHTGFRQTQKALERWLGEIHARDLWRLSEEAKSLVRELAVRHNFACALKTGLVIAAHNRRALRELADDTAYLQSRYAYGAARMMDRGETAAQLGNRVYCGARFDSGGGQLQPLAFARGLAHAAERTGAMLCENTRATGIETSTNAVEIACETGTVSAAKVIVACDAFTGILLPQLAPYIAHVESFIAATAPLPDELYARVLPCDAAVADTRHVLDYYRKSEDRRMLFAGREAYFTMPRDIAALVRPRMTHVFPQLKDTPIEYAWSGTVGITRTRMPHFGRIGERVLFAHGYSGHGVALANLGGKILAEAAMGHAERFDILARVPAMRFPGGAALRKPLVAAGLMWFKLLDRF